jgi:hypothetical protein
MGLGGSVGIGVDLLTAKLFMSIVEVLFTWFDVVRNVMRSVGMLTLLCLYVR